MLFTESLKNTFVFSRILFLFVALCFCSSLSSQVKPVEVIKSKEKVIISGEVFYLHKVEKGQTLYSISRVYKISQKEIVLINPEVFEGLKTGQVLKIPADKKGTKDKDFSENEDYIFHVIEKGETLYSLHVTYNVEVEDLIDANPEIEYSSISINQIIRIPKVHIKDEDQDTIKIDKYIYHRVQKTETLYALSKKYNVSQKKIKNANKNIATEGLIEGSVIRIPNNEYAPYEAIELKQKHIADSLITLLHNIDGYYYSQEKCDSFDFIESEKTFMVALLLPFYIPESEDLKKDREELEKEKGVRKVSRKYLNGIHMRSFNYIDFYQGVLMSLDSLKKKGLNVKLFVYDTKGDSAIIEEILQKIEFEYMDAIIGPIFTKNLKIVTEFAREQGIPVISPLSSDSALLAENNNFFQVNPSLSDGMDYILKLISDNNKDCNYVMFHNDDELLIDYHNDLIQKILFCIDPADTAISNFKEFPFIETNEDIDTTLARIRKLFSEDQENIIIIPSEEEVFVSKVLSALNILAIEYDITLVGYPVWTRFRSIDLEYFHNMNFHFFSPFFTDYNNESTRKYVLDYRNHFDTDPYKVHYLGFNFSMLGYDISYYFLTALMKYGSEFCHCVPYMKTEELLLSDYKFNKRKSNEGFVNKSIQYINYSRDFEVKKVNRLEFSKPIEKETEDNK